MPSYDPRISVSFGRECVSGYVRYIFAKDIFEIDMEISNIKSR